MALKFTRKPSDYISETAYAYDVAKSSRYFDKTVYDSLVTSGDEEAIQQYVFGVAGAKDKQLTNFNEHDYKYLSNEDKASYTLTLLYDNPENESYKQAMEYFDYKVQEGIDAETFASLNAFQKTMNSIGGIVGNAVNETLLGTIEGLVDLGATVVGGVASGLTAGATDLGAKGFIQKDVTGVAANREMLQKFSKAYSYVGKNKILSIANDVVTGIAQMTPLFIPGAGQVIYFGAMAGNTASEAININPNIDYLSLIGYTAAVTGVEFATEKISAGIFGGTGNFIDSKLFGKTATKGLTKVGKKATESWVRSVGLNFVSEGLEESIAEFADTALFNVFIAQGNDKLRKNYSMSDVLYAGLIGGLIGGVMEIGSIASTRKLSVTKTGELIDTKYAKKQGIKTETDLSKMQTRSLFEQLSQAKRLLESDAVLDLMAKYPKIKTTQELKAKHYEEYVAALSKNKELKNDAIGVAVGLAKIFEIAGEESFNRAVELANGTYEQRQSLLQTYLDVAESRTRKDWLEVDDKINKALNKEYGPNVVFYRQRTGLTAAQIRLANNIKNRYGISVYYGTFGSADGNNRKFDLVTEETRYGATVSANEIVLDTKQFGVLSEQEILDKVVKEELVHTIQFTKDVITPRTLYEIYKATGNLDIAPKQLNPAYEGESQITKVSEAQAKAIAEVLLFDDLTVDKMFKTNYSTFNKLYLKFNEIRNYIENSKQLRSQKGKMKYNQLLKSMKMYRDAAAKQLGTAENVKKFIDDYEIKKPEQQKELRDAYIENASVEPIENWTEIVFSKEPTSPEEVFDKTAKKLIAQEKEFEKKAIKYLNDYLKDPEKISIANPGQTYFANQAKNGSIHTIIAADSLQELITELQNKELITDTVVDNLDSILSTGEIAETIVKTTETGQERIISGEIVNVEKNLTKPTNKKTSSFAYTQTDIFDYLDEDLTDAQKTALLNKAIEQENKAIKNRSKIEEARVKSKVDDILKIFDNRDVSLFQGDVDDPEVERVSDELFEEHPDTFSDITEDEFVALKDYFIVRIGTDPVYGAATNTLIRYAWLNRDGQFKGINEYVKALYSQWIATGAQAIGLTSSDYETTISRFLKQLALEKGVTNIELPKDMFLKLVPEINDVDVFSKQIQIDIDKLKKQLSEAKNETQSKKINNKIKIKNNILDAVKNKDTLAIFENSTEFEILELTDELDKTKDPLDKRDIRNKIRLKRSVLSMLDEGEIGHAIDRQLKIMFEDNTNITDVLEQQTAIYNAVVEHLITNSEFKDGNFIGFSSKKIPLSKNMEKVKTFFMGLESFRYLMMLSNPATAIKNFASNTLILTQSFVEDGVLKLYEKSNTLSQAAQGKYTGSYNSEFKNYVKTKYWDKIKYDAEGDKYTSTELQRLQQKYAEAKDPLKKSKALAALQNFERKMLSDKLHVSNRTLLNLTNTLAGTSDIILNQSIDYLKTKYLTPKERAEWKQSTNPLKMLTNKISETNKKLAENLEKAINGDKIAILEVAEKADLDIIKADLKNSNTIYYNAFKRANKLLFKTDNYFTSLMSKLNKSNPAAAYIVRHFIPFVRVAANTTQYIIDRSPIGIAKGVVNMLKTKRKWTFEMREAIDGYFMQQFITEYQSRNENKKPTNEEYKNWFNSLNDYDGISATELKQAMNGDDKLTRKIFESMVEKGMVSREQIGSDNLFARADIMEQFAQGSVGTATMIMGMLLAAILDFDYDEDDYLGPVIKINNVKIALDELSPFTTLFTMGAMLKSNVDNKYETLFQIFADASILSTFESALSYSDGVWDYLKNQSINIATQYMPAFTKAISKIIHNRKKDKGTEYGKKLLNSVLSNTILFNFMVPNKINPYTGQPEKYYDTGWIEALTDTILPVGLRIVSESDFETEAKRVKATTTGLSGRFTINNKDYTLSGKTKQKYAVYKANYVENKFSQIYNDTEKVTIKDETTNKYKTVKYSQLTDEEKKKVLSNIYSKGTTITKIQYWLDKGNSYIVTDRDQYYEYKKLFGNSANIVYKKSWSKSKFVEG